MLTAVAEHDHAGHVSPRGRPHAVVERGTDRRLPRARRRLPGLQRERIVADRRHGPRLAVEPPQRHVEARLDGERLRSRTGRSERRPELLPAGLTVEPVGHRHALGCIGQHEHRTRLPRLLRGHDRRPDHAGHEGEKHRQSHEHEREPAAGADPRAVGAHGEEHGGEHDHDGDDRAPGSHRVERHRHVVQHATARDHAGASAEDGKGGGTANASFVAEPAAAGSSRGA